MIPPPSERYSIGLGATIEDAQRLCERRRDENRRGALDFLNIGFQPGATPAADLGEKIAEAGYWTVLHAVDLNLNGEIEPTRIQALIGAVSALKPRWIEEDLGTWVWKNAYLGSHQLEPIFTEDVVEKIVHSVRQCEAEAGRPFLVENPPVYFGSNGPEMWTRLLEISDEADCGIVLDVGHMIGAYVNADLAPQIAEPEWGGWTRIREVHFSGFEIYRHRARNVWVDNHSLPFNDLLLEWADGIFARLPQPVAVTLEQEGASSSVVDANLAAIRRCLAKHGHPKN